MQEYISKQKLLESLESIKAEYGNDNSSLIEQSKVLDLIFGFSPEDVAPVVHAHWTFNGVYYNAAHYKCSGCGYETEPAESKFCPNCGARMDEPTS